MSVPTFDIFRGSLKNGALWVESVDGLTSAVELMKKRAKSRPGPYFVFDFWAIAKVQAANSHIRKETSYG
jgi:hypothetical protein